MVQENMNIDTCNGASLDEDDQVTLDSSSLRDHANKHNIVEVMMTQIGSPLISELPKSPPISESHKKIRDFLKSGMQFYNVL